MTVPEGLLYSREHVWLQRINSNTVRMGMTAYLAERLGELTILSLQEPIWHNVGGWLGEAYGLFGYSDLRTPIAGEVTIRNDAVRYVAELVNADPYNRGWLVEFRPANPNDLSGLLNAPAYRRLIG